MADPFNLSRFVNAQADGVYQQALEEIRNGRKDSHWMWFVFPQHEALGSSPNATFYGLRSAAEAEAFLSHPVLGPRLREISSAAVAAPGRVGEIFPYPDDLKLRSCATLFAAVDGQESVFQAILDRFFEGAPDPQTLSLLEPDSQEGTVA